MRGGESFEGGGSTRCEGRGLFRVVRCERASTVTRHRVVVMESRRGGRVEVRERGKLGVLG